MCGIFCAILEHVPTLEGNGEHVVDKQLAALLERRGPDAASLLCVHVNKADVLFGGFVLWQQGADICRQPVIHDDIILLFNGDVFNANAFKSETDSDSFWLAGALASCQNEEELRTLLRTLEGPYSLIFYKRNTQSLYFCRDSLGRNSLILERCGSEMRVLSTSHFSTQSSVECQVMELPPLGLYKFNIGCNQFWTLFPWQAMHAEAVEQKQQIESTFKVTITCGTCINPQWLNIDSISKYTFNFYDENSLLDMSTDRLFKSLLTIEGVHSALEAFSILLERSLQQRVQKTPAHCVNCLEQRLECAHAKIAILFSGGIDCSILAILAHKYVNVNEPIELINVAFERINATEADEWNVPDRHAARASLSELQRLCPTRNWKLVEVNVSRNELQAELQSHIKHLIYPLYTVLDESIGSAFWFAARGQGVCADKAFQTAARVVIVGSGADELFGGYTRHRNAYTRCQGSESNKLASVQAELEKDWCRLPSRNLARDDRVVADNGRTLRAPFIEENVVQFVRSLQSAQRCCFRLKEGVGDKLFLRLYGYRLGLNAAAQLKKRAIQFGSRIANRKQNAAELSEYLKLTLNV